MLVQEIGKHQPWQIVGRAVVNGPQEGNDVGVTHQREQGLGDSGFAGLRTPYHPTPYSPGSTFSSLTLLKAPDRYVRRQFGVGVRLRSEHRLQPLERLPSDGHVVVFAAGVADRVPDLVEPIGFL